MPSILTFPEPIGNNFDIVGMWEVILKKNVGSKEETYPEKSN